MLTERESKRICDKLLKLAAADDAFVSVSSTDRAHQRFAANAFTTNGAISETEINLTVWIGQRKGSAGITSTDDASLDRVVRQAEDLARLSPVDVEYVPSVGPQKYRPVHGFVERTLSMDARAAAINAALTACQREGIIGAGLHQSRAVATAIATRHGAFHYEVRTIGSLSMTARTPDGQSSGYALRSHVDVSKIDAASVAARAIRKAADSRGATPVPPGTYPVILEPDAVAEILGVLGFALAARLADEGRSPFSAPAGNRLGQKVFDEKVNFYTDPWHPLLPGSSAAREGLAAEKFFLVRNGVVENLIYSRHWARTKGHAPTPGPVNYILESSGKAHSIDEIIAASERALLVTRFWYIRMVNPQTLLSTGLTRDGVWLVENGKIRHPVRNFRFNQSVMEMLAPGNVEMIGPPERTGGDSGPDSAALFPALKLREFHFTSPSDAV